MHAQWVRVYDQYLGMIWCFASDGSKEYVGTAWAGGPTAVSSDSGWSWTASNQGLNAPNGVMAIDTGFGMVLAGAYSVGVYASKDSGKSWSLRSGGLPTSYFTPYCFARVGANLFLGSSNGLHVSMNEARSWEASNDTMRMAVQALVVCDRFIFAGGGGWGDPQDPGARGIFRSETNGATWEKKSNGLAPGAVVTSLAAMGDTLVAGTSGSAVHISTDAGETWRPTSTGLGDIYRVLVVGRTIFAAGVLGIYRSSDLGETWGSVIDGLTYYDVRALGIHCGFLFAGGSGGISRRPLSELVTGMPKFQNGPTAVFTLLPNFPNPFNPTTTIRYELAKSSEVRLSVSDLLGREVSVLVNEKRNPGVHEVRFDGSMLASGIYLYRLQAGGVTQAKTLVILR